MALAEDLGGIRDNFMYHLSIFVTSPENDVSWQLWSSSVLRATPLPDYEVKSDQYHLICGAMSIIFGMLHLHH